MSRTTLRLATVAAVAATAAVLAASPASAHVTAQPGRAEQGGYGVVDLRVPNESDTAGTVKLVVTLPADHPFPSVRTTPVPGWTATVTKAPLTPPVRVGELLLSEAARTVTWTADPGTRINPGEYLDFPLSLGPFPTGLDTISLPAVQTYDDGEVVAWDQPATADGSEPERPAPVVSLTPATGAGGHGAHDGAATAPEPATAPPVDDTARWLAGAGLLVGALGLGVGAGAVLRSRRPAPAPVERVPEREHSAASR
jgi:periplasmic copper chaperone A